MVIRVLYVYCQSYSDFADTLTRGGGVVGWYSTYCTRTVRVTLTYADRYSDKGGEGGRVVIRVLSELL